MRTLLYVRTSTNLQANGLEAQILALKKYCETRGINSYEIFSDEGVSGAKANRPGLDSLLSVVETGDPCQVISYSLSRLSRSTKHLLHTLEAFQKYQVGFISLSESIDLSTPAGRMLTTVLGAVAELERSLIIERVKCGLENARAKGKRLGRVKTRDSALIQALLGQGLSYRKIASIAKCSTWCVAQEAKCLGIAKIQTAIPVSK